MNLLPFRVCCTQASKGSAALLQKDDESAVMLYNIFSSVVDEKPLDGMWLGEFGLAIILSGINALSVSDGNKAALARLNFIPLVARVLDRFACNLPPIAQCGGGGADVEVAELAVDFLLQMSFFFASHAEMRAVYVAHADLERILTAACQPVAGRAHLTPAGLKTAAALLSSFHGRLVHAASSGTLLPSSSTESKRQHVMLSYAWGARKDLCVALVADLRARGFEVWRDEDGSALVPFMHGATDDIMAEAVEARCAVHGGLLILCI